MTGSANCGSVLGNEAEPLSSSSAPLDFEAEVSAFESWLAENGMGRADLACSKNSHASLHTRAFASMSANLTQEVSASSSIPST
jgi:hypothetical protein